MTAGPRSVTAMAAMCLGGALSSCATLPDVEIGYYLPKASVEVALIQTATCTAGNTPILKSDVTVTTTFASDKTERHVIALKRLGHAWSKSNAGFEFYDDGRLKGINATQTGQGGEVLKALFTLIAGVRDATPLDTVAVAATKNACDILRAIVGSDTKDGTGAKPADPKVTETKNPALTIISKGSLKFENPDGTFVPFNQDLAFELEQKDVPNLLFQQLKTIFGTISAATFRVTPIEPLHINREPTTNGGSAKTGQSLALREPAKAAVRVVLQFGTLRHGDQEEFKGAGRVPQMGKAYSLPLQRAPLFGENQFELALSEAGTPTKLRFAGGADAAGALGALTATVVAAKGPASPGTSDQAKAVQAEADLIYQQQRLVICQATPTACPK